MAVTRVCARDNPEAVYAVGRTASLFSASELIVLANATETEEPLRKYILDRLDDWKSSAGLTVIFWEDEIDASKDALAAAIKRSAKKTQRFEALTGRALEAWIAEEAARRGARLASKEKELLVGPYNSDLWAITQELDKISSGWALTTKEVNEEKVWNLTDAFLKSRRQGFYPLMKLLTSGEDPIYLVGALAASLRTLALVYQVSADSKLKKIAGKLKPFVLKKNSELARHADVEKIKQLFSDLVWADVALKTGQLPSPLPLVRLVLKKTPA